MIRRLGRPKTDTTNEIVTKIHNPVLNGRQLKVRELSDIANTSIDHFARFEHEKVRQRKETLFYLQKKWWQQFSAILMVLSL